MTGRCSPAISGVLLLALTPLGVTVLPLLFRRLSAAETTILLQLLLAHDRGHVLGRSSSLLARGSGSSFQSLASK
jgi:hypothetical protein